MTTVLQSFLRQLASAPPAAGVFNPWRDFDPACDADPAAPDIRRAQLAAYLARRRATSRWALIGEGLSYNGGRFTGLAMTSERILLGHKRVAGIPPEAVLPAGNAQRTSRADLRPQGFTEPTASMVWAALLSEGLAPAEFVLWNAFPWHPFDPRRGALSNRAPTPAETIAARGLLAEFLGLFPRLTTVVAVGNVAAAQLSALGRSPVRVRHPACGGARLFRAQLRALAQTSRKSAINGR